MPQSLVVQENVQTIRVIGKSCDAIANNFDLINALTGTVDSNDRIADLVASTSRIQSLLTSTKTIIDNAVSRNLAQIVCDVSSNTVTMNYRLLYNDTYSTTDKMILYQHDLSNFFHPTSSTTYAVTANTTAYASYDNALYIQNVVSFAESIQKLSDTNSDFARIYS